MIYECRVRHTAWIVYFLFFAMLVIHHITYVWHCGDNVHVELAVKTFLHYLHVEKS